MQLPYRKPGKFSQTPFDPFLTEKKLDELSEKLERLKKVIRPKMAAEVARLALFGDFSENVEYQLAKGKLRGVNNQILILENQVTHAMIISSSADSDVVGLGDTVVIEGNGIQKKYQILGSSETNPGAGIISHNSPIGEAVLGKKVGETVSLTIGKKTTEYIIISKERE
jgi:transcription elongation factor GreA